MKRMRAYYYIQELGLSLIWKVGEVVVEKWKGAEVERGR